eukprot:scaffold93440_cov34-Phaeocystis_antarctica.AAC.1
MPRPLRAPAPAHPRPPLPPRPVCTMRQPPSRMGASQVGASQELHGRVAAAGNIHAPRRVRLDQQCVVEGARLDVDRDASLADGVEDGVAPVEQLCLRALTASRSACRGDRPARSRAARSARFSEGEAVNGACRGHAPSAANAAVL